MSLPVERVRVRAPARLHFGVLDLRGMLGRRFGGMGAAVPAPALQLEAERADDYVASGPDAERAVAFARRYGEAAGLPGRCAHPDHPCNAGPQWARVGHPAGAERGACPGRVVRSAQATPRPWRDWSAGAPAPGWAPGCSNGADSCWRVGVAKVRAWRPLLTRLPMPASWRCVVAVPASSPGLSGEAEAEAFRTLPAPPEREVEHIAHLVLMQLLPALVEEDLTDFGAALAEVQHVTGRWFAASQGGAFAPGPTAQLIARFREAGAAGVGQSSWGPAVYGLAGSDGAAEHLAGIAKEHMGTTGLVVSGAFANRGAVVELLTRGASPD